MGFWNKLGKIVLTAAPYIAAPFTGGASLMATGLANRAVGAWSARDARNAIAQGQEPSRFDRALGTVGNVAGLASSFMPGGALGRIGSAANTGSRILNTAAAIAPIAGAGISMLNNRNQGNQSGGSNQSSGIGPSAAMRNRPMPQGGFRYSENPMNQYDQSSPNLATSIFQGRQEAIRNQPFRSGYDVTTRTGEPDESGNYATRTSRMPAIQSDRPDRRRRRPQETTTETESESTTPPRRGGGGFSRSRERVPAY